MNRTGIGFCVAALLALVCIATPVAYGDTVAFTAPYNAYTAPGNVAGGVYTSPYSGTINGQAVSMICDSYQQTIPGSAWQADAHSFSNLSGARFYNGTAQAQHNYNAAAYLGDLLLSNTLSDPLMNQVSYAIWALFLPDPDSQYNAFFNADVAGWVSTALAATNSSNTAYANWTAYTPTLNQPAGVGLSGGQIQEFLVRTPEAPALAVLGLNLGGLLGLIIVFRRRLVR